MANRYGAKAFAAKTTGERMAAELAQTTGQLDKMATKAGMAQAALSTMETARQLKAVPFNAVAKATENVGNLLIRADEGLGDLVTAIGIGKDQQKLLKYFGTGVGVTVNPALAAIPGILAAGPVLKGVANLARVIGKETLAARGSLPFWRRVSQNSAAGPLARGTAHLFDEMTLGGKVFAPVRGAKTVAKGMAVAAPMDIAFEVLAAGGEMDANTMKRALAESLVFGGSGALAGSVVRGSLKQKQAQQMGDEINFRSMLSDQNKALFNRMGSGARRTMATFSALNPSLSFNLTESGPSAYHRDINTATINVNQSDWLKPLLHKGRTPTPPPAPEQGTAGNVDGVAPLLDGVHYQALLGKTDPNVGDVIAALNGDNVTTPPIARGIIEQLYAEIKPTPAKKLKPETAATMYEAVVTNLPLL